MANNRMWLLHRPTQTAVFLGKRLGSGWYGTPDDIANRIALLFDHADKNNDDGLKGDDFCLAMEDCKRAPKAFNDWKYTTDTQPLRVLEITR